MINKSLPTDSRSIVSDADCVTVMLLNILHGRVALYGMGDWLGGIDLDVLLWEDCPDDAFGDDRLARCLDHIFDAGTDNLFTEVVTRVLADSALQSSYFVHGGTTSLTLQGAYAGLPPAGEVTDMQKRPPVPAHGHSKDFRPDCKQFIYGLNLHGAIGIPLCGTLMDGSMSEQTSNQLHIDKLAKLLPEHDDVTLVHDCKLVDPLTLEHARLGGFHYISILPRSYNLREELVHASQNEPFVELLRAPGRTKADPHRVYRGVSLERPFMIQPFEGKVEAKPEAINHRFVVVHSSSLAAAFEARLEDRLEKEEKTLKDRVERIRKKPFACEKDAISAINEIAKSAELYRLDVTVVSEERVLKRSQRGRPKAGDEVRKETVWLPGEAILTLDAEAIAHERLHASHFVLMTDHLDREKWPYKKVFESYKAQGSIEGHSGFRWLKNVAEVAPVFLKTPQRAAALAMVFLLALMVRNWMEYRIRQELAFREDTLPDMNDRPTARPTTEAAMRMFDLVQVAIIEVGDGKMYRQLHQLTDRGRKVLNILGMSAEIFTTPRRKLPGGCG